MRRFVTLNCLVDRIDAEPFPSDAVQNLRQSVLAPVVYKPILQQALQNVNFRFHRTCSFYNIIRVSLSFMPTDLHLTQLLSALRTYLLFNINI